MSRRPSTSATSGRLLVSIILFALAPAAESAAGPGRFDSIDRCLAMHRSWNYRSGHCEPLPLPVPVDRLFVDKTDHWLAAYHEGRIVREFRVALGGGTLGPKQRQGDGRVPEGLYRIIQHNPDSAYHRSLRISYPTAEQTALAAHAGSSAGGDIMIHGLPNDRGDVGARHLRHDWTDGCIAVTDAEIDWLYDNVPDGTPIDIRH